MLRTVHDHSARSHLRLVLGAALLGGVLSTLVNVLIWVVLRGEFDTVLVGPPGEEVPFWSGAVVLFSLIGALGAGVVYALIVRFTRAPNRVFVGVAVAVLLLSFLTPLSLRNSPVSVVVGLEPP